MIVGIGIDLVQVSRVEHALRRTPGLAERLFAESERAGSARTLAATFAAKEAVAKALGAPAGLRWGDVVVSHNLSGRPLLVVGGTVAQAADKLGVRSWHLSISHDGGFCAAVAVAEG